MPDPSRTAVLVALCCGVALAWLVRATPEWNFDVVCYAGAARTWLGEPPRHVHTEVYGELRAEAPEEEFRAITSLSEYREHVANDVEQFMVQLPIANVKPLYVLLVAVGVKLGASSILTPFYISAVAYGVFSVLLLLALFRVAPPRFAFAVGLALLLSPPFLEVGRMPTPDALSACIVLAGLYALVFAARPVLGAGLLLLSVTARTNNVILCLAVAAWWGWKARAQMRIAALAGGLAIAAYFAVNRLTGGYSWGVLFTHGYLRRLSDPASVLPDVTPSNYLGTFVPALGGANVLYPSVAPLFVVVAALGLLAHVRSAHPASGRGAAGLQLAVWGALVVHFIAFPMLADRFFMVHYACATILAVSLVSSRAEAL